MIEFVNAKINLGLQIVRKRPDGYHDLNTIFLPVGTRCGQPGEPGNLCDILEITPASEASLVVSGADFDALPEQNLVWKAMQKFASVAGCATSFRMTLEKHLPSGAGMGGGSADAAFALRMLNELTGTPLDMKALAEIARELGADVPFFLLNKPAFATGVGECLTPVEIPALQGRWIAVIKPQEGISTAQAFRYATPKAATVHLPDAVRLPVEEWAGVIANDFEQSMFTIHPELAGLKTYLYSRGALYASMTGSGSAFYGIFNSADEAARAAGEARTEFATFASL